MFKKILAVLAMLYAAATFAAVDVNKASAAELDSVKGIGPAISAKIVDERKKGNFKDWNDFVSRVNGVGEKSAAKLSDAGLTVNGASLAGAPAKAEAKPAAAKKDDKPAAKSDDKKDDAKPAKKDDKKDDKSGAKEDKKESKAEAKSADDKKAKKDEKASAKKDDKAEAAKPAASAAKK